MVRSSYRHMLMVAMYNGLLKTVMSLKKKIHHTVSKELSTWGDNK